MIKEKASETIAGASSPERDEKKAMRRCTKCGINPASEKFMVERDLAYCEDCAELLHLGTSKEAKPVDYHPSLLQPAAPWGESGAAEAGAGAVAEEVPAELDGELEAEVEADVGAEAEGESDAGAEAEAQRSSRPGSKPDSK